LFPPNKRRSPPRERGDGMDRMQYREPNAEHLEVGAGWYGECLTLVDDARDKDNRYARRRQPRRSGRRALAGAGVARQGRGRGQDLRCWRSSSISSGHWAREVPPPGCGRSSYFGKLPLLDVEQSPAERSPSRAPDGGWILRRTNGRPPDF
jgi:hypothetical protein